MRSETIRTAGAAETLRLIPDYQGERTIFVAAEVTDREGTLCPWAENEIYFSAENADIIGVDNGSQFSTERFKSDHRKVSQPKRARRAAAIMRWLGLVCLILGCV